MKLFWAALSGVLCTAHISFAEPRVTYNAYGMPGLVDMPSAQSAPDAELSFSVSQSEQEPAQYVDVSDCPPADGCLSLLVYRKANTNTLRPIF